MTPPPPADMREDTSAVRGRPSTAVDASRTASLLRLGMISLGVAVFLTASGAFGLVAAPVGVRLTYWLVVLLAGSVLSVGGQRWIERRASAAVSWEIGLLVIALTVVMTPIVFVATRIAFGGGWSVPDLLEFAPPVFVVAAAMTTLNVLTIRARTPAPVAPTPLSDALDTAIAAPVASPRPRFFDRFPPKLHGAALHAVEAEDHYLRLHTSRGSDLILLRLADAVAELDGLEGAQTHRSWWVARDAVVEARRGDGRAVLVLKDGTEAPVSRTYAPALRRAGWF